MVKLQRIYSNTSKPFAMWRRDPRSLIPKHYRCHRLNPLPCPPPIPDVRFEDATVPLGVYHPISPSQYSFPPFPSFLSDYGPSLSSTSGTQVEQYLNIVHSGPFLNSINSKVLQPRGLYVCVSSYCGDVDNLAHPVALSFGFRYGSAFGP